MIEAVGPGVTDFAAGDRVATVCRPDCAYAEARNAPAARVLKLPDGIDERTAASMMVRGMTARYLLHATYKVKPGDTIVIHAAAGGVGQIVSQWAKHLGATVIGTVGSDGQGRGREGARLRPRVLATTISPRRCASSPAARACRWSTTRSAAPRSRAR